jgi:glycine betaine/proline transport system ATP-binding protein
MRPTSELKRQDSRLQVCCSQHEWVEQTSDSLSLVQQPGLSLLEWDNEQNKLEDVSPSTIVVVSPDIAMRDAIELKHRSGQPILLSEQGKLLGVLNDNELYRALLGNYKSTKAA